MSLTFVDQQGFLKSKEINSQENVWVFYDVLRTSRQTSVCEVAQMHVRTFTDSMFSRSEFQNL